MKRALGIFYIYDMSTFSDTAHSKLFFRHRHDWPVGRSASEPDFQSATRPAAVEPVRAEERGLTLKPAIFDTRQPIRLSD